MLRPATSQDANDVATVLIESRCAFLAHAPLAHTEPDVRSWVASCLIPSGGVVAWEVDNQVVGFMSMSREQRGSWIDQLYVLPGWTGQGIGRQLLRHAHLVLPRPIRLYTFQQNMNARRLYENHGYRAIKFTNGERNEERCPDVLYQLSSHEPEA